MSNLTSEPEVSEAKVTAILAMATRLADHQVHHWMLMYRAERVLWALWNEAKDDPRYAAVWATVKQIHGAHERYSLLPEGWHWQTIDAQVRDYLRSGDDAPHPPHIRDAIASVGPAADAVYFNPYKGDQNEEVQ